MDMEKHNEHRSHRVPLRHDGSQRRKATTEIAVFARHHSESIIKTSIALTIILLIILAVYLAVKPSAESIAKERAIEAFNNEMVRVTGFESLERLISEKGYSSTISEAVKNKGIWEVRVDYKLLVHDGFRDEDVTVKYTGMVRIPKDRDKEPEVIIKV